jgi:hypothetical protein
VLYQPVGTGGKLLTDPYVQEPITGGTLIIESNLSRSEAEALARLISPAGG